MNKRLKVLLDNYINDRISASELREFNNFLLDLDNQDVFNNYVDKLFDDDPRSSYPEDQVENMLKKIVKIEQRKSKIMGPFIKHGIAAAAIMMIAAAAILFSKKFSKIDQKLPTVAKEIKSGNIREYIILPDSTIVVLNRGAKLSYNKDFGKNDRIVCLLGEAFFQVKHNAGKPFYVLAHNVKTKVVGTKFNVNSLSNGTVAVSVKEGKVQVEANGKILGALVSSQQIVYTSKSTTALVQRVDLKSILAWHAGDLFFNDASFTDVLNALEYRFKVEISSKEHYQNDKKLSATFLKEESLDEILEVIAAFYECTFTKKGNKIYLNSSQ
jgi:ferric-dicitrate binding protein FerR (iron transport regulator)